MKNVLKLDHGARPWSPSASARVGEVLDRYDVPLAGFLHAEGRTFLFANILGDGEPTGLWAYTHVTDDEMLGLLRAAGPEEFDHAVESTLTDRCVTVAAAFRYELSEWTTFDSGQEGPKGLADRFMKRLDLRLKEASQGAQDLETARELAGAG